MYKSCFLREVEKTNNRHIENELFVGNEEQSLPWCFASYKFLPIPTTLCLLYRIAAFVTFDLWFASRI